ncbi:MAG: SAP domain-containing protein [Geobacteraceae bacterium]|nr:SAP domain-containing protein [Geobacteraceae bacterium]
MRIDEIKEIARNRGVRTGKVKKSELVRAIQLAEGNRPCFDSDSSGECGQSDCLWRKDCV